MMQVLRAIEPLPVEQWKQFPKLNKHLVCNDAFSEAWERHWSCLTIGGEDECWEWNRPSKIDGYPQLTIFGHPFSPHVLSVYFTGRKIEAGQEVCHRCDNKKCANPFHVYVGNRSLNVRDSINRGQFKAPRQMGEKNGSAKLRESDIHEIDRLRAEGGITNLEIAELFGVCEATIERINSRKQWPHIPKIIHVREVLE